MVDYVSRVTRIDNAKGDVNALRKLFPLNTKAKLHYKYQSNSLVEAAKTVVDTLQTPQKLQQGSKL